jgi:hypothetical protein
LRAGDRLVVDHGLVQPDVVRREPGRCAEEVDAEGTDLCVAADATATSPTFGLPKIEEGNYECGSRCRNGRVQAAGSIRKKRV